MSISMPAQQPATNPGDVHGGPMHGVRRRVCVPRSHAGAVAMLAMSAAVATAAAQPMEHEHAMPAMGEHGDTPLGIPETRDASGTAWQPDSTPMFMWHWMTGGWSVGLHTNVFGGFDGDTSERGDSKPISINWVMAMARHPVGTGDLLLRA